jgi:hypothetical protein
MKKIKGDKPIGVIIRMYMEVSQGNSLCRYLYLEEAKMSCFSFFSLTNLENRGAEQVWWWVGVYWYQWDWGSGRKRG